MSLYEYKFIAQFFIFLAPEITTDTQSDVNELISIAAIIYISL